MPRIGGDSHDTAEELDFVAIAQRELARRGGVDVLLGAKRHRSDLVVLPPWQRAADANGMELPPCLAFVAEELSAGKNASHAGRFALAAFLLKRGMSEEDVRLRFVNAPNYRAELTNMQVHQINSRGYAPYGCEKMRQLGLCRQDETCTSLGLTTPLSYPRRKWT